MSSRLNSVSPPGQEPASRLQRAFVWFGAAALAAPLTIVLHELGHFLTGAAFGFPDLVLRYGSVGSTAAERGFPLWQQGLQAAAGPLVTILIVLLCCLYVARRGPQEMVVATGMVAPVRFLIGVVYLGYAGLVWLRNGRMEGTNFDEYNVARASGIPLEVLLGFEVLFMLGAWWFLAGKIHRRERGLALLSVGGGMVIGLLLWVNVLGPQLF